MATYVALIHKDPDSDYGVSFPDFPGCITAVSDLDEAYHMALEALEFHVKGMIEDGDPIPDPTLLESVLADPENSDASAVMAIPLVGRKSKRVDITLPEIDLVQIDRYAEKEGLTRSAFLLRTARAEIQRRKK